MKRIYHSFISITHPIANLFGAQIVFFRKKIRLPDAEMPGGAAQG